MYDLGHLVDSKKTCVSEVSYSPRLFLLGSVGQGIRSLFALDNLPTLPFRKSHSFQKGVEDGQNGRIGILLSPCRCRYFSAVKTGIFGCGLTKLTGRTRGQSSQDYPIQQFPLAYEYLRVIHQFLSIQSVRSDT